MKIILERENKAVRVEGFSVLDAGFAAQRFVLKHRELAVAGWQLVFYGGDSGQSTTTEKDAVSYDIDTDSHGLGDEVARLINPVHACPTCECPPECR